eukprot:TRINITY_DN10587_c0_g1_i1.p1 TRINITY_DN10587_c0_g1~~TRINITY_DN10587_c0_g1_i1.p1  ORF type:complete len:100 (+),score=41.51 TRINITY_DN10587_c0_g1_i1:40-300(+)
MCIRDSISATFYILYMMHWKKPYSSTYEKEKDDFEHFKYLLPIALVLTLCIHTSWEVFEMIWSYSCLLYTSPSPRDQRGSRMPSSA